MKTSDLFSMAVIVKDLGIVLVAVANSAENGCIFNINCINLQTVINEFWNRYSLISGLEFNVIPDCSQVEGYEIIVHRIDDPHILLSVNFNLS